MPKSKSYVSANGKPHYRKNGRYNETTTEATHEFKNSAVVATKQENLAPAGNNSAAAQTYRQVLKELTP